MDVENSGKLFIKNMVCDRCKMVVKSEIEKAGYKPISIELGEIILDQPLSEEEKKGLNIALSQFGFSIIDTKRSRLIEQIKNEVREVIQSRNNDMKYRLSDYLAERLHYEYNYLSTLFSEVEGSSIEKYYIAQKIEKVKELLVYDELNLSEIAFMLNYSSAAHLSNQFKKVTGLTPSYFKNIKGLKRQSIDQV